MAYAVLLIGLFLQFLRMSIIFILIVLVNDIFNEGDIKSIVVLRLVGFVRAKFENVII